MSTVRREVSIGFDVEKVREDFPVLKQTIHGKPLLSAAALTWVSCGRK